MPVELAREIFAWVTVTGDGRYSVIGAQVGPHHLPLIAMHRVTLEGLRDVAIAHGAALCQPVALVRFAEAAVLERYP